MAKAILVLNDAEATLDALAEVLAKAGYAPLIVTGADDPVACFGQKLPELVFLSLKEQSALKVCEGIRDNPDGAIVPIIFVGSGGEAVKSPSEALTRGGDYFFKLPLDMPKVLAKVQTYVGLGLGPVEPAAPPPAAVAKSVPPPGMAPLPTMLSPDDDFSETTAVTEISALARKIAEEEPHGNVALDADPGAALPDLDADDSAPAPRPPPIAPRPPQRRDTVRMEPASLPDFTWSPPAGPSETEGKLAAASDQLLDEIQEAESVQAEQARRRSELEARRRAEEEGRRRAEEVERAREEEQRAQEERERAEVEARRAAEEAKRLAEEEARRQVEADAQRRAQEDTERRAGEVARRQSEAEAQRRAEEERRQRAEEEARRRAEEDAQRRVEEEARHHAEEEARRRIEEEARHRAEEEARRRAEEEAARQRAQREKDEATQRQTAPVDMEAEIRRQVEAEVRRRLGEQMKGAPAPPSAPAPPARAAPSGRGGPLSPAEGAFSATHDIATLMFEIWRQRVSGKVEFTSEARRKTLFFELGAPVAAFSTQPFDRIEEYLLREGKITRAQYQEIRVKNFKSPRQICAFLVSEGHMRPQELFDAVRGHLAEVFYGGFEWEDGGYFYTPERAEEEDRVALDVDARALMMEGIRRKYLMPRLMARIGSPSSLLAPAKSGAELDALGLATGERHLAELVDGTRSIEDLVLSTGMPAPQVYQVLLALVIVGHVEVRVRGIEGVSADGVSASDTIDRQRIRDKAEQVRKLDYFQVLGVPQAATAYEIDRAHERLMQEFHPGRFSEAVRRDLSEELADIEAVAVEARDVLRNEALRDAYARHLH